MLRRTIATKTIRTAQLAAVTAAAVALGGCGARAESNPTLKLATAPRVSAAIVSPTAPTSAPATKPPGAVTKAMVSAVNVQSTDFTGTWTSTPYLADPQDAADEAKIVACVGTKPVIGVFDIWSPSFDNGAGNADVTVYSEIERYSSLAERNSDVGTLLGAKANQCALRVYNATLKSSSDASGATITAFTGTNQLGRNGGPATEIGAAHTVMTFVNVAGMHEDDLIDDVVLEDGLDVVYVYVEYFDAKFGVPVEQHVLAKVNGRLANLGRA